MINAAERANTAANAIAFNKEYALNNRVFSYRPEIQPIGKSVSSFVGKRGITWKGRKTNTHLEDAEETNDL